MSFTPTSGSLMRGATGSCGTPIAIREQHSRSSSKLLQPGQTPLRCWYPHSTRSPSNQANGQFVAAIDNFSTKLLIPMSAVEPTQALKDDGLVPGLCRLFLEGRCRQGDRCFQVHANQAVVEQLRQEALHEPSCCYVHHAACNYEGFPLGLTVTVESPKERDAPCSFPENKAREEIAGALEASSHSNLESAANEGTQASSKQTIITLHNLSPTNYLWNLYREKRTMNLTIPVNKICREHRKGLCRFGDECSFVHVCREIPLFPSEEEAPARTPPSLSHSTFCRSYAESQNPTHMQRQPSSLMLNNTRSYHEVHPLSQEPSFNGMSHNSLPYLHSRRASMSRGLHPPDSLPDGSYSGRVGGTCSPQGNNGNQFSSDSGLSRCGPLLRPQSRAGTSTMTHSEVFSHNPYIGALPLEAKLASD